MKIVALKDYIDSNQVDTAVLHCLANVGGLYCDSDECAYSRDYNHKHEVNNVFVVSGSTSSLPEVMLNGESIQDSECYYICRYCVVDFHEKLSKVLRDNTLTTKKVRKLKKRAISLKDI